MNDWTIFYWGWWISWAPFVGVFLARISKGRTVREFLVTCIFLTVAYNFLWMTIWGGAGLRMEMTADKAGITCTGPNPNALNNGAIGFLKKPVNRDDLQVAFARRTCGVPCANFFDDIGIVDLHVSRGSGQRAISHLFGSCGLLLDSEKEQRMAVQRIFLGQCVDVGRASANGQVQFCLKPGFREDLSDFVDNILDSETCTSGTAAKLRGKAGWASSAVHGKCGRSQAALVQRQYFDVSSELTPQLANELVFIKLLHTFVGPRQVQVLQVQQPFCRLYSDASFEPSADAPAKAGFVLFSPALAKPLGMACTISDEFMQAFNPRQQQITPCEAALGIIATFNLCNELRHQDVIWFIDNQAACSALVKGSSSHGDLAALAAIAQLMLTKLGTRTYFEWVDTEANPADGLSRAGLADSWTKAQHWQLREARLPDFEKWKGLAFGELCSELADVLDCAR
jgi:hypothetical protein